MPRECESVEKACQSCVAGRIGAINNLKVERFKYSIQLSIQTVSRGIWMFTAIDLRNTGQED